MSKAHRIICVSSAERDMLADVFNIDHQKVWIVPNGVDNDLASIIPESGRQGELRILSVARFDLHYKKTDRLIKAFKMVMEDEIKLYAKILGQNI